MAWRKRLPPPRIEPPEWYRNYHPEAWDEPDGHELAMIGGCARHDPWPGSPVSAWPGWPAWLHDEHARRRWQQAKHAYLRDHPDLAEQRFGEIVHGELSARQRERNY